MLAWLAPRVNSCQKEKDDRIEDREAAEAARPTERKDSEGAVEGESAKAQVRHPREDSSWGCPTESNQPGRRQSKINPELV